MGVYWWVYSDGRQQYGVKPLTADFVNELYVRVYNTLFNGTGKVSKTRATGWTEPLFRKDMHCSHSI